MNIPMTRQQIEDLYAILQHVENKHYRGDDAPVSFGRLLDLREKFEYWEEKTADWASDVEEVF